MSKILNNILGAITKKTAPQTKIVTCDKCGDSKLVYLKPKFNIKWYIEPVEIRK